MPAPPLSPPTRYPRPDVMRGSAILLMIFFHGWYDLSVFGFVTMSMANPVWYSLRAVIVSLFCLTAGASLVWAHSKGMRWRAYAKRQGQLALGALIVTVFSLVAYPTHWIYFGILHFFVLALFFSLPLLNFPRLSLILGVSLIAAERLGVPYTNPWAYDLLQPILNLPGGTMDRMYLLPWLGVVWVGIWLGHQPWLRGGLPDFPAKSLFIWLGQRPLVIYLVHQPVLFGLAWALAVLF